MGFTDEERSGFGNYIRAGFTDSFRHNSWRPSRGNIHGGHIGRTLASVTLVGGLTILWSMDRLVNKLTDATIYPAQMGFGPLPDKYYY